VLLGSAALYYYDLIGYGLKMAKSQFSIIYEARPIEEVLNDSSVPDSIKAKIKLVQDIRKFAFDSLELKFTRNYSTFYQQEFSKPLLWTISACPEFSLEPYEWGFPIIGKFPYKGFFDISAAEKEAKQFDDNGFDVELSGVGGWSTLGWFKDPILSGMLRRKEAQLADLIIHELSHSSFFVKDDATLNENLANFIGKKGAIWYMKSKYGAENEMVNRLVNYYKDDSLFNDYMLNVYKELETMYNNDSFKKLDTDEKRKLKAEKIETTLSGLKNVPFYYPEMYLNYFENEELNNAYLTIFGTYEEKQEDFELELINNYQGDLRLFIKDKSVKYPL
jgi:predicted aminopeptidase